MSKKLFHPNYIPEKNQRLLSEFILNLAGVRFRLLDHGIVLPQQKVN